MYEEYLTKSLSDLVLARQAICNYESNKGLKDMKNLASYMFNKLLKRCLNTAFIISKLVRKLQNYILIIWNCS